MTMLDPNGGPEHRGPTGGLRGAPIPCVRNQLDSEVLNPLILEGVHAVGVEQPRVVPRVHGASHRRDADARRVKARAAGR